MPLINSDIRRAISRARELAASRGSRFAARLRATEFLEIHVLDRLEALSAKHLPAELEASKRTAVDLSRRWEAANQGIVERLRRRIRRGRFPGLRKALLRQAGPPEDRPGYDAMDALISALLDGGTLDESPARLPAGMVAYQPTPGRTIMGMITQANLGPDDVFYDLGCGLGRVAILVALLSGARALGIEYQKTHCQYARRAARRLKVRGAKFIHADARNASLRGGTVYYLFTPFRGAMLRAVLKRLRGEATKRTIRVCAFGPCVGELARADWLRMKQAPESGLERIAIFLSR